MKQQLHKICFYTADKHVRDLLVSVGRDSVGVWLMFSALKTEMC